MDQQKLSKYAQLAEIIAAVGVVIGLIFVGLELQQNTHAQRVTATQILVTDYTESIDFMSMSQDVACVYVLGINGLENLNGISRYRFFTIWFHIFRSAEQLHFYAQEGMIDERIWRGFTRQIDEVSRLPGVRQWWAVRKDWFSDDFQAYIDDLVANSTQAPPELFGMDGCEGYGPN
jgi:hypothetical protein